MGPRACWPCVRPGAPPWPRTITAPSFSECPRPPSSSGPLARCCPSADWRRPSGASLAGIRPLPREYSIMNDQPRPRLYLADDSRSMRSYYTRILKGPYEVVVFEDGGPLLEAARISPPDVIVSDVNMPEMNGLDLVRALKADPRLRPVPVILLTASDGEEGDTGGSVACLDAGAD